MEKVFEIMVYKRLSFLNEALDTYDKWNGGCLQNIRTADNMFILNGVIQKQLILRKPLYICFVDFSNAFDLVNRNALFYKTNEVWLEWAGYWYPKKHVFENQIQSKMQWNAESSHPEWNRGEPRWVCSGLLFRKYVSDLEQYLMSEQGICIDENIVGHLLWADDLILFSDSVAGLQKQLNGVMKFCSNNRMLVNESKTKVMQFGKKGNFEVYFNGTRRDEVLEYKYLGAIVKSIQQVNQDVFPCSYQYLCDQSRKAIFCTQRTTKCIEPSTPEIYFYMFDYLARPILTYGSEVWGASMSGLQELDRVFLQYMRCVLRVKATTSNLAVYGECGRFSPTLSCHVSLLSFFNRLHHMPDSQLVKQVYKHLNRLHEQGFTNWTTKALDLANTYDIDIKCTKPCFRDVCKYEIKEHFINEWRMSIQNTTLNPILRTYNVLKTIFGTEPYPRSVKDIKYRVAISKLRVSSHALEIERGRYTSPMTPVNERLCHACQKVEVEFHFMMECKSNSDLRQTFINKLTTGCPNFADLSQREQFVYMFTNEDNMSLTWLGKFIYKSFQRRNSVGSNLWNIYWYDYSLCIYIYIYIP